jgi:hypothetical protein
MHFQVPFSAIFLKNRKLKSDRFTTKVTRFGLKTYKFITKQVFEGGDGPK